MTARPSDETEAAGTRIPAATIDPGTGLLQKTVERGRRAGREPMSAGAISNGTMAPRTPRPKAAEGYGSSGSARWIALAFVLALHIVVLGALIRYGAILVTKPPPPVPLMIDLTPLAEPAPSAPIEPRPLATRPVEAEPPPILAPPPIVAPAAPAPPIVVVDGPAAPSPPVVERAPVPAPDGPVAASDLSTRLISATPPRYPLESRHAHESGVVILAVVLSEDGGIESVSINESSGFGRLDRAALAAVRTWRWSPTVVDGRAIRVQGLVRIPFELLR